jgi:hypothetical protein
MRNAAQVTHRANVREREAERFLDEKTARTRRSDRDALENLSSGFSRSRNEHRARASIRESMWCAVDL